MDEIISVIIPVYNVKEYLPECMESILAQTYSFLEIILVDDGSTDDSDKICDQYAEKDLRVRVFHQKNAGAGAAKNTGLKKATGKYLAFLDSDDYLEPDAMEYMHSILINEDADVVQCCYHDVFLDKIVDNGTITKREVLNQIEYLRLYVSDWTPGLLWDKLYKRKLFDDILFETGHIVDDEFFTYRGIMNASRIVRDPQIVYNYRKRQSSVTMRRDYCERVVMDKLDYLVPRRRRIVNRYPVLKRDFDKHFLYMMLWLAKDPFATYESICRIKKILRSDLCKCIFCGIELQIIIKLLYILFAPTKRIMLARDPVPPVSNTDVYFE